MGGRGAWRSAWFCAGARGLGVASSKSRKVLSADRHQKTSTDIDITYIYIYMHIYCVISKKSSKKNSMCK